MRNAEQQLQPQPLGELKAGLAWVQLALGAAATPWSVLGVAPGTKGSRSGGLDTVVFLAVYPIFGVGLPPDQKAVFSGVWYAVVAMLVVHFLATARARGRGVRTHRRDVGRPWFGSLGASTLLGVVTGFGLAVLSPPAGLAVGLSALAFFVEVSLIRQRMAVAVDQLRDAEWENEQLMRLRRGRY